MKLLFHIGAGKTGSTSIQNAMRANISMHRGAGVHYLGLMLENSPIQRFEWQDIRRAWDAGAIRSESVGDTVDDVADLVISSLDEISKTGGHTAVWSNEAFFTHHATLLPVMRSVRDAGHEVQVLAYVRNHADWARSAYEQWGIRHKTYEGRIERFSSFVARQRVEFAPAIEPWAAEFGMDLVLRNYDVIPDVVEDFAELLDIRIERPATAHGNRSVGMEELLFRALFNDRRANATLPAAFDGLMHTSRVDFDRNPLAWLRDLLPSSTDLEQVALDSEEDREQLAAWLSERGQPPLKKSGRSGKEVAIDHDVAVAVLFQMIEAQAFELRRLRRDLDGLDAGGGDETSSQ